MNDAKKPFTGKRLSRPCSWQNEADSRTCLREFALFVDGHLRRCHHNSYQGPDYRGVCVHYKPAQASRICVQLTMEKARDLKLQGWNLRCNLCGSYGATWAEQGSRPGWGCLALCKKHLDEYREEQARHRAEFERLRLVKYEQEHSKTL